MSDAIAILRWDEAADGALSERAMRAKLEALGYPSTRWVYPPGTVFDTHTHDVDKIDAVLSGTFALTMSGRTVLLRAGDAIRVPRGAPHRAEVIGDEPVVSLDGIARRR